MLPDWAQAPLLIVTAGINYGAWGSAVSLRRGIDPTECLVNSAFDLLAANVANIKTKLFAFQHRKE